MKKLTKSQLIKQTKAGLKELGFEEIKDTITPAQGLYIKPIGNELYLSLGLTISRLYDNMFTASFYLSKTTIWALVGNDIPKRSYERIGCFLTRDERLKLLDKEYSIQGITDAWWNAEYDSEVAKFLETVRITEPRFIEQPGLFDEIKRSSFVNELALLAHLVIKEMKAGFNLNEFDYHFLPTKPIDNIPLEWFKAAERAIVNCRGALNLNTVKRLAADAWRQSLLK